MFFSNLFNQVKILYFKTILFILLITFHFVSVNYSEAYTLKVKNDLISIKASDEPVISMLEEIGKIFNLTIIVPRDYQKYVSLDKKNISIEKVLEQLLGRKNVFQLWEKNKLIKIAILNSKTFVNDPLVLTIGLSTKGDNIKEESFRDKETIEGYPAIKRQIDEMSTYLTESLPPLNMPGVNLSLSSK